MAISDIIDIDFQTNVIHDPRYLSISDFSVWGAIENRPAIIEITIPGAKLPIVHEFKKKALNIFDSHNLLLNSKFCHRGQREPLPDGVYYITVKGSPDKYRKSRKILRIENARIDLDKLYIELNMQCKATDKCTIDLIQEIEFLLRASEANVRSDNICVAQELLLRAQKKLVKLKECKSCVGVGVIK